MSLRIWWLNGKRKRTAKMFDKLIRKAKTHEDKESLISEAMAERDLIEDEILHQRSMDIQERAQNAGLPVPPFSDKQAWQDGINPATTRLSPQAQLELNRLIRAEERDRWSVVAFLVKEVAAPLIGAIGAVMGLLSLIHSFFPQHSK
jgi:hypothetical protein